MRVYWDDTQLLHTPRFFLQRGAVKQNFEVPARASALLSACRDMRLEIVAPPPTSRTAVEAVHSPEYVDFLRDGPEEWRALADHGAEMVAGSHPSPEMVANGARASTAIVGRLGWYTTDAACPIGPDTWAAAEAAAGCAVAAADEASAGRSAYALTRPPGHHAYPARAGGHCYLNNAAIAAERLLANGAARVAILDIDSHHGNGTQGTFWTRDDVVFVSVHGDPAMYYPWFVGHATERGACAGAGCNLNLPLPRACTDDTWLAAIEDGLALIRRCGVDALVVSLGFDASRDEPLGFLSVSDDGFARAGRAIATLGKPCAVVQEGGYNLDALGRLLARFLGGLIG